jgi:hypothetical protein
MSAALSEHSNLFSTVAPVLGIGQEVGGHNSCPTLLLGLRPSRQASGWQCKRR